MYYFSEFTDVSISKIGIDIGTPTHPTQKSTYATSAQTYSIN